MFLVRGVFDQKQGQKWVDGLYDARLLGRYRKAYRIHQSPRFLFLLRFFLAWCQCPPLLSPWPCQKVAITIGASQALYVSFQAILSPGDEVVLLEPFFDLYLGQIRMAGGVAVQVPLGVVDREWRLDADALRRYLVDTAQDCVGAALLDVRGTWFCEVSRKTFAILSCVCCIERRGGCVTRGPICIALV